MKPLTRLLLGACLVCGCANSERAHRAARFSDLPKSQPDSQPQASPRGEAPAIIYVDGEFRKPGAYTWTNGMTLKDAIATAGGFTDFAMSGVRLVHWDGTIERYKGSAKRPLSNNPMLKPGDRVISPRE